MTWPVLTRASEALTDDETIALLRDRIGDGVIDVVTEFGDLTWWSAPRHGTPRCWPAATSSC